MGAGAPNGNRYQIATAQYFQQWNQIGGWCAGVKVGKVDYQRVMVKKFWGFTTGTKLLRQFTRQNVPVVCFDQQCDQWQLGAFDFKRGVGWAGGGSSK